MCAMTSTTTIGERLRLVRVMISLDEFSRVLGVHKNTLANYEKGLRVPDANFLNRVLEVYPAIDPEWLLTGVGAQIRCDAHQARQDRALVPEKDVRQAGHDLTPENYVQVPRYDVEASAGAGAMAVNEQIVDYIQFKPDWIKNVLGASAQNLALISVKGDSMEPTLSDGDILLVDTTDRQFQANAIYVLQNWGSLLVKRIQRKMDGSVVIKSDNKDYEPETVRGDMVEQLHVIGRVVWYGRRG